MARFVPPRRRTVFIVILLLWLALTAGAGAETIRTLDGRVFKNATVTRLSPEGATIEFDFKAVTIPYEQWPAKLRNRYGYDSAELKRHIGSGIEGVYGPHEQIVAFAGEVIRLDRAQFAFSTFSDVIIRGAKPQVPLKGGYRLEGQWLILDNPEVREPARVLVVVEGRLALMTRFAFQRWRDSGKFDRGDALFRKAKP